MEMDWTKHAKVSKVRAEPTKPRRVPVTVTVEMQKVIEHFKTQNSSLDFTDTGVLMTFLEAGVRLYLEDFAAKRKAQVLAAQASRQETTPVLSHTDLSDEDLL